MEPWVWVLAAGSICAALLSGAYVAYEVRKFDKRFGKQEDWDR